MEMGLVKTTETMKGRGRGQPEGRGYAEYLLVVYPDSEMQERLLDEQQRFSDDYGPGRRLDQGQRLGRNKPHITVAVFQAGEEAEDTLIRWIQRICQQLRSFDLALNNYSGIPPHTICLRVQDPAPLMELMQQLGAVDEFIRSSGWPPVHLTGRPYLSIAGGLTEQLYNKAMPEYSRKTFHGIFRVNGLVLLRRRHSFDPCKTVNVFGLKN
jgi:2'-5' RNA ligase